MPMDIRNFFAAKGGGKKKDEAPAPAAAAAAPKATAKQSNQKDAPKRTSSSSLSSTSRGKVVPTKTASKKPASLPPATNKKKTAKNRLVIDDDSDEDDDDGDFRVEEEEEEPPVKPPPNQKNKPSNHNEVVAIDDDTDIDDDDDDDEYVEDKKNSSSVPSTHKRKPDATTPDDKDEDEVVEVSAAAFFASTASKHSSPRKKRKATLSPQSKVVDEEKAMEEEEKVPVNEKEVDSTSLAAPKQSRKRDSYKEDSEDDDGDDDYEEEEEEEVVVARVTSPPPPKKKGRSPATSSSSKKGAAAKKSASSSSLKPKKSLHKRNPPLVPQRTATCIDSNQMASECLAGYTFVFSGVLDNLGREESEELIKELGGRITSAVSGKTDYLVVGEFLEDGRPFVEGGKYKKAKEKGTTIIVQGAESLYGLIQQYDEQVRRHLKTAPPPSPAAAAAAAAKPAPTASVASRPPAAAAPVANPYAKVTANPYARKSSNPYAKKATTSTTSSSGAVNNNGAAKMPAAVSMLNNSNNNNKNVDTTNMLWVDKYKPASSNEILGNGENARKLGDWLRRWEDRFNNQQSVGKAFSNPNGPWKAALLSGPPGIGKTTTATIVALENGRDVIEFNASDVRSKKALKESLGDITGSQTISFGQDDKNKKTAPPKVKRCIIMDEVDGMGAGDRSGMSELIQMIKHSRVPIICICNDRQAQKIRSLVPYCLDLKYARPIKTTIANRAVDIALKEGLSVERNAAEAIVESCGNDIRQVINCLQMWASNNKDSSNRMTYKDLKQREHTICKDEILRVNLFDATKTILQGRNGLINATPKQELDHFFKRNDAFFVDYNLAGLMVQQNYLKVVQGQFNDAKRSNDSRQLLRVIERMHSAAESMSDFAQAENALRGEQNWSLLPFTGMLAVKTGFHAGGDNGGFLPGYPEFSTWLGRNSTKGRKSRLLNELGHHANYHISGGTQELRLSYLPVFRDRLLMAVSKDEGGAEEAVALMDEYGFDRDDVFEKLDEFNLNPKAPTFAKIDSKKKAAFTRAYNEHAHKSQVLVAEQGAGKVKRTASKVSDETKDPDVIDDDNVQEEDDDDNEEELDAAKIQALFKKTRKRGASKTAAKKPAAKKPKAAPKAKATASKKK